ncbi:MAG TPA: hypothetical protein VGO80_12990 [Solirubrobacteraceae bacterium]|jgi:glutathione synthase/RimK-type ligase-like ATP-grasp enzyme|nr:hypothetical protein [Solirubrobacteraceae bacterium]
MRIAFCTNIRPVADPSSLRGRNHALVERLRAAGHKVDILHGPEKLLRGDALPSYDVGMLCPNDLVEVHADPSGRLRADTVAVALEYAGVQFLNSPLRRRFSTNKLLTHVVMASAGLPQPDAWTLAEIDQVTWPQDGLLVKPITGSGGLGVTLVHSREDAMECAVATRDQCFLQQFLPDARCIRVVATQHASIGRYEKRVPRGTIVAGITSGAEEVKLDPREDLDHLAIAMARAVEMDIVGADILETADGALFGIEVNANFGFYPSNREIVDALVERLHEVARRSRYR